MYRPSRMDLAAAVRVEQRRALYRQSPFILSANVVIALLVSLALWHAAPKLALCGWLAATVVIAALRFALMRRVQRTAPDAPAFDASAHWFVASAVAAGAAWGVGVLLFYRPESALSQIVLTFAIGGMTAAAAGTWASHPPVFWGYFLASLGPLLARTLALGDTAHLAMGSMLIAYTVDWPAWSKPITRR